tara:strand:- start:18742 stop:19701 length:960 start_codon:yes stop_codon:yes gene_type:complete
MQVEVILASEGPNQRPIYTIRMRYPRIIHGEIMTHRVFSRNARSSRAVPVKTMLLETTTMPFIPWHWGANQKGMQASEECKVPVSVDREYDGSIMEYTREEAWLEARDRSVEVVRGMMDAGYHKQIPNRLLEPFSWIDTLITSTEWDNFLWLRDHKDAEPHLQDLARLVKVAIESADIQQLQLDQWHQPYVTTDDRDYAIDWFRYSKDFTNDVNQWLNKISAARCARISYKPFDGDASYEKELERYNMLVSSDRVHASPTEHQATPDTRVYVQRAIGDSETDEAHSFEADWEWENPHLHGNFEGYIQARKLIPNECYKG